MIVTSIYSYELVRKMRFKYAVRIFFSRKRTYVFYLSEKQYKKLYLVSDEIKRSKKRKGEILVVIDDENERFVWCGVHYSDFSDKEWLTRHFKASYSESFYLDEKVEKSTHIPERITSFPTVNPVEELKR